jgi:energy-converting hydrogenase Eha subunit E
MSEQPRKEKNEKDEKGKGDSWDEKWRRDPVEAAVLAIALIWAGIAWLLSYYGFWDPFLKEDDQWWAIIILGAGVIVLLGVLVRVVVPAYRRPWVGSLILGVVLVGVGLGGITEQWVLIGPLILIGIGIAGMAAFFTRRKE